MDTNVLYYGDNLEILRGHIPNNSVDLIYLDPPFNSKATYNVLFKEPTGEPSQAQITAFEDTWHWGEEAEKTFQEIVYNAPARVVDMINAFRSYIGSNDMMAYLTMMCIRLLELKRVLKDTGSIYLHCDPTASHYLRVVLDTVFGVKNFRNEIVWYYRGAGVSPKYYAKRHDILLFYSKSDNWKFNPDPIREPYAEATVERFKHYIGNVRGSRDFGIQKLHPLGKHPDDVWQIQPIAPSAKLRLGYPTQKPEALLEKIIQASSEEGDIILDPFCGCGTALVEAQRLNRQWIGVDITHLAISVMKWRLGKLFPNIKYKVIGEPKDLAGAKELASQNKYQFQWWAISLVDGQPYGDKKKGADTGIDGYIYFMDEKDKVKKAIVQVKSGSVSVGQIRDLAGVIDREKAGIGLFISLEPPTKPMETEAVSRGFYKSPFSGKDYQKIQMLTIEELLSGKKPDIPHSLSPFQLPSKSRKSEAETPKMV